MGGVLMSQYYHIQGATILSGPFSLGSSECKRAWLAGKNEHRGNFEGITDDELLVANIVPQVYEPLADGQKHGTAVVSATAVTVPAIAKSPEELAQDLYAKIEQMDQAWKQKRTEFDYISVATIWDNAKANKAKAKAVSLWVDNDLLSVYFQRKYRLLRGEIQWSDDLLIFPDPPYNASQVFGEHKGWPDEMVQAISDGVITPAEDAAMTAQDPTLWQQIKTFFGF